MKQKNCYWESTELAKSLAREINIKVIRREQNGSFMTSLGNLSLTQITALYDVLNCIKTKNHNFFIEKNHQKTITISLDNEYYINKRKITFTNDLKNGRLKYRGITYDPNHHLVWTYNMLNKAIFLKISK